MSPIQLDADGSPVRGQPGSNYAGLTQGMTYNQNQNPNA